MLEAIEGNEISTNVDEKAHFLAGDRRIYG